MVGLPGASIQCGLGWGEDRGKKGFAGLASVVSLSLTVSVMLFPWWEDRGEAAILLNSFGSIRQDSSHPAQCHSVDDSAGLSQ